MEKFYRSRTNQKIAGICGGIGEVFHLDANLVRIGLVFVTLLTQVVPMVITYLAAWMILPKGSNDDGA